MCLWAERLAALGPVWLCVYAEETNVSIAWVSAGGLGISEAVTMLTPEVVSK